MWSVKESLQGTPGSERVDTHHNVNIVPLILITTFTEI